MSDELDMMGLGVASALTTEYSREGKEFLGYLTTTLKSFMPECVTVKEKGLFKKTLIGLTVSVGQDRLNLDVADNGALAPTFTKVVRGIALKTEELTIEEWIAILSATIQERVSKSETSRNALAKLLALP